MRKLERLLHYVTMHQSGAIRYYGSSMQLQIQSDVSYLCRPKARSVLGGFHFLGFPERINGPIFCTSKIISCMCASVAEAELGAAFQNAQKAEEFLLRKSFHNLRHTSNIITDEIFRWNNGLADQNHLRHFDLADEIRLQHYKLAVYDTISSPNMTLWSTSPNKHGHFGLQPKSIVFGTTAYSPKQSSLAIRPSADSNRLSHFGLQLTAIVFGITGFSHQPFLIRFHRLLLPSAQLRSKSMDVRFSWFQDRIRRGQFAVKHLAGRWNISDFSTKSLPKDKFEHFQTYVVVNHTAIPVGRQTQTTITMQKHSCEKGCVESI
jgi:hypothetical protein